ncbi:MAG: quinone-dependent dihydroorotate dehydrogenase [Synechococcus sp.]
MYSHTLRPLLFRIDPERLHRWAIAQSRWLALNPYLHPLLSGLAAPRDLRLQQTLWGLTFQHPVGLAAGFDKNAEAIALWPRIGFAFSEVGTITAQAQAGNPLPRLFRLPADEAVINRYGFNNEGANVVAHRLTTDPHSPAGYPVGLNLGKSKLTPLEEAPSDYLSSFQQLYPYGDYFVVNVSSPNTPGLRKLQSRDNLERIVSLLQEHNSETKPLLVKIAPDLTWEQLDELLELVLDSSIAGIIATNTTLQREGLNTRKIAQTGRPPSKESGGLSGPPVRAKSTEMVRYIYRQTDGKLPIIGVGGIDSADAAWEKIAAGASLVQLYTGLVYEGPGLPSRIVRGLIAKLDESGFSTISEAVGYDCG